MSDIPSDIDWIATNIVRAQYTSDQDPEWEMYVAIARAILAERERCAQIADEYAGLMISHEIRNPDLPSGAAACAADTPASPHSLLPPSPAANTAGDVASPALSAGQSNSLPPQAHPSHKGSDSPAFYPSAPGSKFIHQNASVGDAT